LFIERMAEKLVAKARALTAIPTPGTGERTETALDPANAISSIDYAERLGRAALVTAALRLFLKQGEGLGSQTTIGPLASEHGVLTIGDLHWIIDAVDGLARPESEDAIVERVARAMFEQGRTYSRIGVVSWDDVKEEAAGSYWRRKASVVLAAMRKLT
jgi:hypothetical protein